MLNVIDKSIVYSNKIVNDLMDYSREIRLELENTTPKKLVESSLSLVNVPSNIQIQDLTENNPTFVS